MKKETSYAKLDSYDYTFLTTKKGRITNIIIKLESVNDVDVADISGEVVAADGKIYVEGYYFDYVAMYTYQDGPDAYLDIEVKQI